jgi:hypothetical protein
VQHGKKSWDAAFEHLPHGMTSLLFKRNVLMVTALVIFTIYTKRLR